MWPIYGFILRTNYSPVYIRHGVNMNAGSAAITAKMLHAKLSIYLLNIGKKLDDGSVRRDERWTLVGR